MQQAEIRKALKRVGFSDPNIEVLLVFLSQDTLSIQEATKLAKLPRSTVALAIKDLEVHGVLHSTDKGKRKSYYLPHVDVLQNVFKKQEDELVSKRQGLQALIDSLSKSADVVGSVERTDHAGAEGYLEAYKMILNDPDVTAMYRIGVSYEKFLKIREVIVAIKGVRTAKKKKVPLFILAPDTPMTRSEVEEDEEFHRETVLLPVSKFNPDTQITVGGDRVIVTSMKQGNVNSFVVRSADFAVLCRQLFSLIWDAYKK